MKIHPDGNCENCKQYETIEHAHMHCVDNIDLINRLKTICSKKNEEFNLKTILKNNECTNEIGQYFIYTKRRKILLDRQT
jgi:hypothetical protein